VVQAVMEAARGDIHVETAPGSGTTIELRFPLAR
jgi:chemotaxis protein histidine kinase CheA